MDRRVARANAEDRSASSARRSRHRYLGCGYGRHAIARDPQRV